MKEIRFLEKAFENRFEYHLPTTHKGFLQRSIFDTAFDLDKATQQAFSSFLWNNGISSFASRENGLLYFLVLKKLSKNNICYLIYFDSDDAANIFQNNLQTQRCEWRYGIEYKEGDVLCTSLGIQNPVEFLASVKHSNRDLTNRHFHITEIDPVNLIKYAHLYSSDVTNWSFVFCPAKNKETLLHYFTDPAHRPSLPLLLAQANSLVHIQIGGDEGYLDYLLIQSNDSIDIADIENKMSTCATHYEKLLEEVGTIDDPWKTNFFEERFNAIFKNE